jgi:hypothetical protein
MWGVKTHRINLHDWESDGLLAGRITALCRVVRPQPATLGPWMVEPTKSPFGSPGDVVLGREAWAFFDRYSSVDDCQRGPNNLKVMDKWTAPLCEFERALLEYWKRRLIYRAESPYSHIDNPKWRSSTTQPDWAIRHRLTTKSVRCVRVRDVTKDDCLRLGISVLPLQSVNDPSAWYQSAPGIHQERTAQASYRHVFNRDNPRNPWADNPWVWIGEF